MKKELKNEIYRSNMKNRRSNKYFRKKENEKKRRKDLRFLKIKIQEIMRKKWKKNEEELEKYKEKYLKKKEKIIKIKRRKWKIIKINKKSSIIKIWWHWRNLIWF